MSETTPETGGHPHLTPVREDTPGQRPAQSGPARKSGGHMTGLLALLLAASVFAFLAQFSANRQLQIENQTLRNALAASQAELQANRGQMEEARSALGGLRGVLQRIEGLLTVPAAKTTAEPAAIAPAAE